MLHSIIKEKNNNSQIFNILKIIRSENIGPRTFYNLIDLFKTPDKAIEAIPELTARNKNKKFSLISDDVVNKEIEQVEKFNAKLITYNDAEYPALLKQVPSSPPVITVKGDTKLLSKDSFAIVGSRNASQNGMMLTSKIAKAVSENNWVVTSGLARGIDHYAHVGSIERGTIAVVAGGIDIIYPPENEKLYNEICEKGLVIAEMPFNTAPLPKHFPLRNRIISGISYGTLVVEASLKSGSLITAKYANDQGREVFAIPGFPLDQRYKGPNHLIKQGAYLVEDIEDLLKSLDELRNKQFNLFEETNDNFIQPSNINLNTLPCTEKIKEKVINLLSYHPVLIEEIIKSLDYDLSIIYLSLLELELAGLIVRTSDDKIVLSIK